MYTQRPCTKCICQACYDDFHRCKHKLSPTTMPKEMNGDDCKTSVYMDTYIKYPYRPPVASFKPVHKDLLRLEKTKAGVTSYRSDYGTPQMPAEDNYSPLARSQPSMPPMEKESVYMKDYNINLHPSFREQVMENLKVWFAKEQKVKDSGGVLSFPKRPPRPYDYSKCEDELTGVLYVPRLLRKHRRKDDKVAVQLPIYHSDDAPSSYFGGSTMKIAYRAGLDSRHMPCCRPEQKFHPERLQQCLAAQPEGSNLPCPKYVYEVPDRAYGEVQKSLIGIKATFSMDTTYQDTFKDHYAASIPNPRVGDRGYSTENKSVIQMANSLPMDPGFLRCDVRG